MVVFDGWKSGSGTEHFSVRGGVKVIFSRIGEKADSVINRILSEDRREWIVVSSDREIAEHAWATGSIPVSAEEFVPFLGRLGMSAYASSPEEDEDIMESKKVKKGNPRKLSGKGRDVRRALGKL